MVHGSRNLMRSEQQSRSTALDNVCKQPESLKKSNVVQGILQTKIIQFNHTGTTAAGKEHTMADMVTIDDMITVHGEG